MQFFMFPLLLHFVFLSWFLVEGGFADLTAQFFCINKQPYVVQTNGTPFVPFQNHGFGGFLSWIDSLSFPACFLPTPCVFFGPGYWRWLWYVAYLLDHRKCNQAKTNCITSHWQEGRNRVPIICLWFAN